MGRARSYERGYQSTERLGPIGHSAGSLLAHQHGTANRTSSVGGPNDMTPGHRTDEPENRWDSKAVTDEGVDMFSPGVNAILVQAHLEDLARRVK